MGQQKSLQKTIKAFKNDSFYELDIRLLEKMQGYASSFPADLEQIITEADRFYKKQPENFMVEFLISQINDRFNSNSINKEAMESVSNNKTILEIFRITPSFLQHKFWNELENMERFLKFLEKVEQQYWIERKLYEVLERVNQNSKPLLVKNKPFANNEKNNILHSIKQKNTTKGTQKATIRQPLKPESANPTYKTQLHQPLFKKLFFYYYQQLIRAFCASKNGLDRPNAINYHVTIGRNILKIVAADFISEQKLFQLLYNVLKIQKTQKSLSQLEQVSAEYEIYCLKHEHNISVNKEKLEKIKLFTRCYLDQLYFLAIKQAEDPEIIDDGSSGDSGLVPKSFPINRVKQKNRNM